MTNLRTSSTMLALLGLSLSGCATDPGSGPSQTCFQASTSGELVCQAGLPLSDIDVDGDGVEDSAICVSADVDDDGTADVLDDEVDDDGEDDDGVDSEHEFEGEEFGEDGDGEEDDDGDDCEALLQRGEQDGDADDDGIPDAEDDDDDNDGETDDVDDDQDGDGELNDVDIDDDNDGVPDVLDSL